MYRECELVIIIRIGSYRLNDIKFINKIVEHRKRKRQEPIDKNN